MEWLTIAAGSDYEPVFGRIREVLTQVGRMKFLRPLFVALGHHTRTQQLGRDIYDAAQATYHSLSRRVIEAVMAQWATHGCRCWSIWDGTRSRNGPAVISRNSWYDRRFRR